MIKNGRGCTNIANDTFAKKLIMNCVKHPKPYRLQWWNEYVEIKVTKK